MAKLIITVGKMFENDGNDFRNSSSLDLIFDTEQSSKTNIFFSITEDDEYIISKADFILIARTLLGEECPVKQA